MKNRALSTALGLTLLMTVGCEAQPPNDEVDSLPPVVEELQNQKVPEVEKEEVPASARPEKPSEPEVTLYRGVWFDIEYPHDFTVRPIGPSDEAYFTSPDRAVEFFIFSPLWAGEPESYLRVAPTEELVSEKTQKVTEDERPGQYGDTVTHWVTLKAKDDSYYRSFVSIKEQVGTGSSELHHVFGIKYTDWESYLNYKEQYLAFKESLRQYAD